MTKDIEIEKLQMRVNRLISDLEVSLLEECKKHNYLAGECYIALSYLLNTWRTALGPEAVKQIENCFHLVDRSSWEEA